MICSSRLFYLATRTKETTVQASLISSQIIAGKPKPSASGSYVKECIVKVAGALCPEIQRLFKNVGLPANTVS